MGCRMKGKPVRRQSQREKLREAAWIRTMTWTETHTFQGAIPARVPRAQGRVVWPKARDSSKFQEQLG